MATDAAKTRWLNVKSMVVLRPREEESGHGYRCRKDSLAECEVDGCIGTPRRRIHGNRCRKDSLHQPSIELIDDTVEDVEFLAQK